MLLLRQCSFSQVLNKYPCVELILVSSNVETLPSQQFCVLYGQREERRGGSLFILQIEKIQSNKRVLRYLQTNIHFFFKFFVIIGSKTYGLGKGKGIGGTVFVELS
jgi:hypothetical protein